MPPSYGSEWFADSDLNHDGYIDEREWSLYQARDASENCLVAIRGGGRGDGWFRVGDTGLEPVTSRM